MELPSTPVQPSGLAVQLTRARLDRDLVLGVHNDGGKGPSEKVQVMAESPKPRRSSTTPRRGSVRGSPPKSGGGDGADSFRRSSSTRARRPSIQVSSPSSLALVTDPLGDESRRLLSVPPAQRDTALLEQLVTLTNKLAGDAFASMTDQQHYALARSWRYQFFAPGADVCMPEEACKELFIVLEGACELTERQVHHLEGRAGSEGFKRVVNCRRGRTFGHYPLVHGEATYDFAARATEPAGCCLLLVPKVAYVQILRKEVEKAMKDTVAVLKANKTFSNWSVHALARLYFWFVRRRYSPGEAIVRQGEAADFCFVIRSGECDVLVQTQSTKGAHDGAVRAAHGVVNASQEQRGTRLLLHSGREMGRAPVAAEAARRRRCPSPRPAATGALPP